MINFNKIDMADIESISTVYAFETLALLGVEPGTSFFNNVEDKEFVYSSTDISDGCSCSTKVTISWDYVIKYPNMFMVEVLTSKRQEKQIKDLDRDELEELTLSLIKRLEEYDVMIPFLEEKHNELGKQYNELSSEFYEEIKTLLQKIDELKKQTAIDSGKVLINKILKMNDKLGRKLTDAIYLNENDEIGNEQVTVLANAKYLLETIVDEYYSKDIERTV